MLDLSELWNLQKDSVPVCDMTGYTPVKSHRVKSLWYGFFVQAYETCDQKYHRFLTSQKHGSFLESL